MLMKKSEKKIKQKEEKDETKEVEVESKKEVDEPKEDVSEIVRLSVDDIDLWAGNPNEEDQETFNMLVQDIREENTKPDEMDQPLIVIKNEEKSGRYIVMSGNHRYKAVRLLGAQTVKCVVKEWDEKTAVERSIRRNMISGKLNQAKFTKLVNDHVRKHKLEVSELPRRFGFTKQADFFKNYRTEKDKALKEAEKEAKGKSKEELKPVENLQFLINKMFREYGDTLDQRYMFFMFGNKLHLMAMIDEEVDVMLGKITQHCFDNKVDISSILKKVMSKGMEMLEDITAEMKGNE